jgi:SAM-dependent methyltransferase
MKKADSIFSLQERWTRSARNYLYRKAGLLRANSILETGCGTGIITSELANRARGRVTGMDNNPEMVSYAAGRYDGIKFLAADGLRIPFLDNSFDIVVCNYYLIWVSDPAAALAEMRRVTVKGGKILICAEPDYDAIIEYPMIGVADTFREELKAAGVGDLSFGRKLTALLNDLGCESESGVINYTLSCSDLEMLIQTGYSAEELRRVSTFIQPIFYAIAYNN